MCILLRFYFTGLTYYNSNKNIRKKPALSCIVRYSVDQLVPTTEVLRNLYRGTAENQLYSGSGMYS